MAEETTQADLDYVENERTYAGFVALTKISIVSVFTIMLALCVFAFGGSWSFSIGVLIVLLATVAATIGIASNGSATAPLIVFGLSAVLFVLSVAS